MKQITEEQIQDAARVLANITHGRTLDKEERYYQDYQKYDGIIIGAKWMQDQHPKWISVDINPDDYGKYLIHKKDGKIHWETWNGSGWAYNSKVITHWMRIPKIT